MGICSSCLDYNLVDSWNHPIPKSRKYMNLQAINTQLPAMNVVMAASVTAGPI